MESKTWKLAWLLTVGCSLFAATTLASDDLNARREQVESLSLSEQQQLLRDQERFNELTVEQQDRIRKLHEELSHDPNSAKLRAVLERYYEWLKTLSPEQRAELAELGPDDRIERIKQIMSRQHKEQDRRRQRFAGGDSSLPREDLQVVFRWFSDVVWQHREELLKDVPQPRRDQIEKEDQQSQRRTLMFIAFDRWKRGPLPIEAEDLDRLTKQLSPATQERLAKADAQEKKRLAKEFFVQAVMSRRESFSPRRWPPIVSNEELEQFFQNDLPEKERQRLMNMPRDQMREELRNLYGQHIRRSMSRPEGPPGSPGFRQFRPGERMDRPDRERPEGPPEFRGRKRPPFDRREGTKKGQPPDEQAHPELAPPNP